MGGVVYLWRPTASHALVAKLVELGYLQQAKRHRASAIENAIERLRGDLCRNGAVSEGDLSRSADGEDRRSKGETSEETQSAAVSPAHSRSLS